MTEWWVSQKKNFCEYCKVWTGGHLWQIRKHEEGRMHTEKKELYLKNARQRQKDRERDEEDVKKQLADIEKAALAAMGPEAAKAVSNRPATGSGGGADIEAQKAAIEQTVNDAKRRRVEEGSAGSQGAASSAAAAAPAAAAPAAPVPAAEGSPWLVCTDPNSGHVYYYNKSTGVSAWERPPDLGIDLSKPPPPPASKPPPPPARKKAKADGAVGGWEEVKPEDSMWGNQVERQAAARRDADSDEENMVNPLGELKVEVAGRKGNWSAEDLELRQVEMVEKRSQTSGSASFPMNRKKAGGIRKKREDD